MKISIRLSLVAVGATMACSESMVPRIEGTFALSAIGSASLPQPTMATSTDTIFADTILVTWATANSTDGTIRHRLVARGPGGARELRTYTETVRRTAQGVAFIPPPCGGPLVDCFYAERSGQLNGNSLRISFANPAFKDLVYVRF